MTEQELARGGGTSPGDDPRVAEWENFYNRLMEHSAAKRPMRDFGEDDQAGVSEHRR
jgi:hypothetical protein